MEKKYLIYKITNTKNHKSYIGQTCRGLEARWKQHVYNAVNNVYDNHFKRAIRKYGEEAFSREILIGGLTLEEANRYEELYVELYGTFEFGYNSKRGGNNHKLTPEVRRKLSEAKKGEKHPLYGKTHSEEARKKISEANKGKTLSEETKKKLSEAGKGRTHSEETRKKISEAKKGGKSPMYGKTHSDEAKRKISEAKPKTPVTGVDKETGEVLRFESTIFAARSLKIHDANISRASKNNRDLRPTTGTTYSYKGFYWFYPEDYEKYKNEKEV